MSTLQSVVEFFNHPVFIIVGGLAVLIALFEFLYRRICNVLGISPLVWRIGKAIWHRKIAIVGDIKSFVSLSTCISETGIFKKRNVIHISIENIDMVKAQTVLLVDWESSKEEIKNIFLQRRSHNTAVIIYAKAGSIPHDEMGEIANSNNTVVVNFKGRLLNDILNSLITTSF